MPQNAGTQSGPRVSRPEEALYGPMAAALRQLGLMVANAEDAQADVAELLENSRDGDAISAGMTKPSVKLDEQGRSEHTQWLVEVFERVLEQHRAVRTLYQQLAHEAGARWMERQHGAVPVGTSNPTTGTLHVDGGTHTVR